ncbi:MAG: hypothetical protein ACRDJW_06105 [Thermomicrobiales bacterium]
MGHEIADWQAVFDLLRLTRAERDRIFYGNAARIFGLDEFAGVTNEAAYDDIWNANDEEPVDEDGGGSELAALEDEEAADLVKR